MGIKETDLDVSRMFDSQWGLATAGMKVYAVYFSPSGSTEKIVKRIAKGFEGFEVESVNLLTSASRKKNYTFGKNDVVVFGMMTAGKLFTLSDEIFECLHGDGTPFVGVITYGNSYYGIALTEMKERAEKSGFSVASMGAFIARHSLDPSVAEGRPDSEDLKIIDDFARESREKILRGDYVLHDEPQTGWSSSEQANNLIAYRETHRDEPYMLPPSYKTKIITNACIKCGKCVRNCPVNAINIESKTFDLDSCIGCWGCINRCPNHAIISTSQEMSDIMKNIGSVFSKRLEPEIFM
ncbi:MAG: 4Fe-4S binding protein [Synergistaceae bacterium]|nr:4Fe-4S binding protein [Synergistaceae bacterium]